MKDIKSGRTHHPMSEAELAARKAAVERAARNYGTLLFNYIKYFIKDYHLAQDLLQTLWLCVFEDFRIKQIRQVAMLRYKAQQLIIDRIRHKIPQIEIRVSSMPETACNRSQFLEPATPEAERQLWKAFWDAFKGVQLTDNEKNAFWLKERYGYTITELSEHFKLPRSTVCDWVQRVKRECASYLSQEAV
jgi:RNA polymerase sigma factor (sigma-70 family)